MAWTSTNITDEATTQQFTTYKNMAEKEYQVQFPVTFEYSKVIQNGVSFRNCTFFGAKRRLWLLHLTPDECPNRFACLTRRPYLLQSSSIFQCSSVPS